MFCVIQNAQYYFRRSNVPGLMRYEYIEQKVIIQIVWYYEVRMCFFNMKKSKKNLKKQFQKRNKKNTVKT